MKLIKGGMIGTDEISDFYIGETLVTQALWQTVMGNNPSEDNSDLQFPVTDMGANDIKNFLTRLKRTTGTTFDIPTGSQYKYAALKGCETMSEEEFNEMRWGDDEWHPVCGLMPNRFGLFDLGDHYEAVHDSVPNDKDDCYHFNPIYKTDEDYGARIKSLRDVRFSDFITIRLVINIPVDPNVEKAKKESEKRESSHLAIEKSFLFRISRKGKYGFIDRTGKIVIPCKFDFAHDFSEGLALVGKGTGQFSRKYGYIDMQGKQVVPFKYADAEDFSEGLARVEKDKKYGFIDKTGKEVIPCKYGNAKEFHEGLACVYEATKWSFGIATEGEWVFIDKTGKKKISCKCDFVESFSEGLARVEKDRKYGYIDITGKEVIPCRYDDAGTFSEGLAWAERNGKCGYIDKTGKEVFSCMFENVGGFHEGLALVGKGHKYGFIDKTGKEVIPCKYSEVMNFHEGLACVATDGKYGYIDKDGNEVIPCKFEYDSDDLLEDYASDFHNGLAYICDEDSEDDGYIDKSGNKIVIINPKE